MANNAAKKRMRYPEGLGPRDPRVHASSRGLDRRKATQRPPTDRRMRFTLTLRFCQEQLSSEFYSSLYFINRDVKNRLRPFFFFSLFLIT